MRERERMEGWLVREARGGECIRERERGEGWLVRRARRQEFCVGSGPLTAPVTSPSTHTPPTATHHEVRGYWGVVTVVGREKGCRWL